MTDNKVPVYKIFANYALSLRNLANTQQSPKPCLHRLDGKDLVSFYIILRDAEAQAKKGAFRMSLNGFKRSKKIDSNLISYGFIIVAGERGDYLEW